MNLKIKMLFVILLTMLVVFPENSISLEHRIIKVAILDAFIPSFDSPENAKKALDGYTWKSGNKIYTIDVEWISDLKIITGFLRKYDVLLIPGIGKEFRRIGKFSLWKENIRRFVKGGGGYVGMCGGANLAVKGFVPYSERGWSNPTLWEWCMSRSCLGLIEALSYQDMADPFACSVIWKDPSRVGISAFIWYNLSWKGVGLSLDLRINKSHPLFSGYDKEYVKMRWNSGPAFVLLDKNVSVIAWYPKVDLSLTAWRYVGPLSRDFLKQRSLDFWDKSNKRINFTISGLPAAISSKYGKGRVVIFGPHPEHPVQINERIQESRDTNGNRIFFGGRLYRKFFSYEDISHNWWLLRRSVAWAAGIAEEDLPS